MSLYIITHSIGYGFIYRFSCMMCKDTFEYFKFGWQPKPFTMKRILDSDMMPVCMILGVIHCFYQPSILKSILRSKYCFES